MKKFYGGVFINNQILEEAGIKHPIKLEYYKNINYEYKYEEEKENQYNAQEQYNNFKYGISVVKTEYLKDKNKVEEKEIKELTNDEIKTEYLLNILKENYVTPIGLEDILNDIFRF
ncbi:MAG: hypothetical protein J6I85_00635 [Clostridia bacterium]|nr:hypothetical protein [Clostridia bacterium]MBP3800532.1 hypothetical protein [Clostridia bacterium]